MGKKVKLDYSGVISQFKFLQGKVLTVIEASFSDERQLKAVKDLINKMFSEQMTYCAQLCFPETVMMTRDQVNETIGNVEKIEKEAEDISSEYGVGSKN